MGFAKDGGNQFLGSCLAIRTGDADNLCAELAAVVIGKLLHGLQAVVYKYIASVAFYGISGLIDDGVRAPGI